MYSFPLGTRVWEAFIDWKAWIWLRERKCPPPAAAGVLSHRRSTKEDREQLDAIVAELLGKHGLRLRFEEVVHHDDNDSLGQRLASSP
ncbi:hypothetical protein [Streptomyces sp. ISL-66]|uniref:hypothetical protein n=1 Tax=Streptomyces sp. ISL-66 TaxID=2819186 RepID=UPI0020354DB0|nr:hypothetical protein [Streptomyces sp. ISL-66]